MLSFLILLPALFAIVFGIVPSQKTRFYYVMTNAVALLQVIICSYLFTQIPDKQVFSTTENIKNTLYFVENYAWFRLPLGELGTLAVDYFVGIDNLNLLFVCLTSIVFLVASVASKDITDNPKAYFALFLLLNSTVFGCFVALDFFLFFLFFEFMLLPMYFLIGLWGGIRREYAAIKFFIYTFLGSILLLFVMISLGLSVAIQTEEGILHTFNMLEMTNPTNFVTDSLLHPNNSLYVMGVPIRSFAFLALLIGFAIKLPAVPVHTWLPDAHVEAPTPISMVLAGILLKIGGYGIIRTAYRIFPVEFENFAIWICAFGILSMLYAGFVAMGQTNLKKLIAYSSISHMGYVLLGLGTRTQEGFYGAIYQLCSHGILSVMLFFLAGILYNRTHNLEIENYKGLLNQMPKYSFFVAIAFFASLGLPGFSGFIGEMLVLAGAFHSKFLPLWAAILACFALLLGAAYFLWTYQRMFLGKFSLKEQNLQLQLTDLTITEKLVLLFCSILAVIFGLFPNIILNKLVF
jgi:NADH-quinone oxidoreductase subunit M